MSGIPVFQELRPFGADAPFRLEARCAMTRCRLEVRFRFSGDVSGILFPAISNAPVRRDRLWETTCFEFFLNPAGTAAYWEFNFAPSGDWAAYRFEDYRAGMRAEERVEPISRVKPGSVPDDWTFAIDLSRVTELNSAEGFHCGLTAVVEAKSGEKTHWAVSHAKNEPDFHARAGFVTPLKTA